MKDSLSLAISSNTVSLNLNPAISPFDQETILTTVGTNNPYGYKLYLNSSTTSLVRDNSDGYFPVGSEPVIETLGSTTDGYTESNFPANRWGYKLGSGNYFPFATGLLISSSDTATTTANTTSVTFGAKVDYEKPAGNYNMTLNFTAVAGVAPTPAMQDFTRAEATAMSEGDTRTLRDLRDDQEYSVAKIGDTVWMTRNLAIGCNGSGSSYGSGRTTRSLTSSNSNVSDTWSTSSAEDANESNTGTSTGYTTAAMQCSSTYGAWYNYVAATAGTISGNPNTTDATEDICPSGWRLPTNDEFSGITSSVSAFSPVTGGYYFNGSPRLTENGYWWSATTNNDIYRYSLYYNGSSLRTDYNGRYSGRYVRCVFDPPTPAMQDFTEAEATAMSEGDTRTLRDLRDDQEYSVAKIGGTVWMTKNLNIAGGTTLTSATSNVSSDYTLPASSTSGFSDDATAYVYNSGRTDCSAPGCYSYYSYKAATAGTDPSSGNATSDICPKGWRLPTQTELDTLASSYNTGAKLTASPFLAVYGGYYYNSSFNSGGSVGRYWSSTADSSTNAYNLNFRSSNAFVLSLNKRTGFPVRCIKS